MAAVTVRYGTPDDLDVIVEIWLAGIRNSLGTDPPGGIDYRAYFSERLNDQNQDFKFFLVEDASKRVVAWQSLLPFRANPAVRETMAEISAYTHPDYKGGRATVAGLAALFSHADNSDLHFAMAVIADGNRAAANLALKFGMQRIAVLPRTEKAPDSPPLELFFYDCGNGRQSVF